MFPLIKELTEMAGPIGQEQAVLDAVERLWQEVDGVTVERTKIGNLLAHVPGDGPRLLIAAHADELSYLVRAIHPDGFIWLANGQAWQRTNSAHNVFTLGQRVKILGRHAEIPGVIATMTGHLATLALPEPNEWTWRDFWVETGLTAEELAAAGITPGTRVIWDAPTTQNGPLIIGKALDDRALLAIQTEMLKTLAGETLNCRLTLAATVQEEIGLVGATALAARHPFDAAIALEIGLAGDVPGVADDIMPLRLGAGPVLVHKDALVHYDHRVTAALEKAAQDAGIDIQHAVFGSFGSDGAAFMKADIPAALVAFPARYTHTPFETAHLGDMEDIVEWLCAFTRHADQYL